MALKLLYSSNAGIYMSVGLCSTNCNMMMKLSITFDS